MEQLNGWRAIAHFDHKNKKEPHLLDEHKEETRTMAKVFASSFDPYFLTETSSILHDAGKKNEPYQIYVQDPNGIRGSVKHSIGGAYALMKQTDALPPIAKALSYFVQHIIAGHHSGLYDFGKELNDKYRSMPKELEYIESLAQQEVEEAIALLKRAPTNKLECLNALGEEAEIYFATLVRFAMSAMVDADWLSTEAYFSKERAVKREYDAPSLSVFQEVLDEYCQNEFEITTGELSEVKKSLQCLARKKGKEKHSFFTLHAPTGSGKTIAALQFALAHAIKHKKRRIITALPLTNLTEELSTLYRKVFGKEHVVEDHSNALIDAGHADSSVRLAAENWDRPFVVSTTVQLFESLFHNKPMKVRKLHRLYGSIIILDEYHKLPLHVLRPILKQLDILQKYFDVTVLMMSATPYALAESRVIEGFTLLTKPLEITDRPAIFEKIPKRVLFKWLQQRETIESITGKIALESTVLTIVNTRKEAQKMFLALKKTKHSFEKIYHLSTTMCSDHRRRTLIAIREDLTNKRKIAVVSTSVLEAGIDIDFPTVYRMLAPLDAIVQAAGRCNRYGKPEKGIVVIFELENSIKVEMAYEQGITTTKSFLQEKGVDALYDSELFVHYFKRTFSNDRDDLDRYNIKAGKWLSFRIIAREFEIIEDERLVILCTTYRYFDEKLLKKGHSRAWWRKIQPFTVSLSKQEQHKFMQKDDVRILTAGYDDELGVIL